MFEKYVREINELSGGLTQLQKTAQLRRNFTLDSLQNSFPSFYEQFRMELLAAQPIYIDSYEEILFGVEMYGVEITFIPNVEGGSIYEPRVAVVSKEGELSGIVVICNRQGQNRKEVLQREKEFSLLLARAEGTLDKIEEKEEICF